MNPATLVAKVATTQISRRGDRDSGPALASPDLPTPAEPYQEPVCPDEDEDEIPDRDRQEDECDHCEDECDHTPDMFSDPYYEPWD